MIDIMDAKNLIDQLLEEKSVRQDYESILHQYNRKWIDKKTTANLLERLLVTLRKSDNEADKAFSSTIEQMVASLREEP